MNNEFVNANNLSNIGKIILAKNQTIAVAESVTAGHMQVAFSLADNAINFFQGGITVYNIGQKVQHLSVEPVHALSCNCVSEKVAIEMAINVCDLFLSDWGIAITGYASTVPEEGIIELFSIYAISYKSKILSKGIIRPENSGNPVLVRHQYVNTLLEIFNNLLSRPEGIDS
ncbi:nicotinamide-nucleotide amidohydrolase family protein [Chitinophaga sp. MM2321]|uniref:CinA family protein n=1 Tax=Chitinophaga sp. MM2321 TaxID=3137178 RepID=UPI0032D5A975